MKTSCWWWRWRTLTHTHSVTQSLTSSNGSFSIPNKHKLPRWILSTLRGANIVSLGAGGNLQWNLVIKNLNGT